MAGEVVWLEWVHFDGERLARWIPQARYDRGERAQEAFYDKAK
jgi:hypothetical protein